MRYRELGTTGARVSEIGYGAWGIGQGGWVGSTEDESITALHRALDLGINLIDTARGYGESERIVGRALRQWSGAADEVFVASKIGPTRANFRTADIDALQAYPAAHLREGVETSLRMLGRDHLDLLQLHLWHDAWTGEGEWLETVEALKREGKIRFFGISVNDHQPENILKVLGTGVLDTVQVIYNIFEQRPQERLLPACQEHGVGVIGRVALDEGGLTGRVRAGQPYPEGDWRNQYFRGERAAQVEERVAAIVSDLGIGEDEIARTALRFATSGPGVSTVIVGMRTVRNVERNVPVGDAPPLTGEERRILARHRWDRNFYQ
ncbi:aldo/keto reductase [Streptomyces xiamenensis]